MRVIIFLISILLVSVIMNGQSQRSAPSDVSAKVGAPPKAEVKIVVDDYHGRKISDPYRWLEDAKSPETQRFVDAENAYTQQVLESLPGREQLRARIQQLLSIGRLEAPR